MKMYCAILVASTICAAFASAHTVEHSNSARSKEIKISLSDSALMTAAAMSGDTDPITAAGGGTPNVPTSPRVLAPLHEVKQTRFDSALWINTTIDVSANGHVDGRIRVWSKHFFVGFTGSALIYLRDTEGNILFRIRAETSGVNGEAFGRSDVTKTWGSELPAIVRDHVSRIEIVNAKMPQKWGNLAEQNAASIAAAYKRFVKNDRE